MSLLSQHSGPVHSIAGGDMSNPLSASGGGNPNRPGSVPMLLVDEAEIPPQNCFRLVLLGSARVGKTSIVSRFLNNKFDENYTPTIEDFHRKVYKIRGEAYRLDILDTSGNDPFPAMKRLSLLTGDLFIIVYSIDCRESFEEASRLRDQIFRTKQGTSSPSTSSKSKRPFVPMVIVGNKCDRETDRLVDPAELRQLTELWAAGCAGLETSAKKNINIEEIFLKLFILAKVPTEMSPSLHRKVQPVYAGSPSPVRSNRRLVSLRRRLSDACGAIALNARRPSIRTDLLILQTKQSQQGDSGETDFNRRDIAKSCVIQ